MAKLSTVEVLEHYRVSPPPGFIPPSTSLPLTIFDLPWLILKHPVERLFFYSYHHEHNHFMDTTLPKLKHSLSLTLQHFFPLAGTLTWPPQSTKPHIHCSRDNLDVSLTVAESIRLDFNNLVGNHPRDVNEFYPLVPQLTPPLPNTQVVDQVPVMALQVTLFPNTGICIGISYLHVVADGKAISHFIKSWALLCKSSLGGDDTSCLARESLPVCDRNVIHDPNNFETSYLNELAKLNISQQCFYKPKTNPTVESDNVRATFLMRRPEIQELRRWIVCRFDELHKENNRMTPPTSHLSTFVITCSCVWVCLIKVLASGEDIDGMERECLGFLADCRERLNYPIPMTYFGNCLMDCVVDVKRGDLIGKDGIAIAAEAIMNSIHKTKGGALRGGENFFANVGSILLKKRFFSIAGSPKFGFYDTDFGWGRPRKLEVISIDNNGAMSLSECRDGEGGIEVGLVLNKFQMDAFTSVFADTLRDLS